MNRILQQMPAGPEEKLNIHTLIINSDKEIIAYAEIGGFENGIEAEISQNVLGDNPLSYKYIDGELIKNANYISPTDTVKTVDEQIQRLL